MKPWLLTEVQTKNTQIKYPSGHSLKLFKDSFVSFLIYKLNVMVDYLPAKYQAYNALFIL